MRRCGTGVVGVLSCAMLAGVVAHGAGDEPGVRTAAQVALEFGGEQCVARASRASTLGFTFPVEIAELFVKGGQKVKAGDKLVRARDEDFVAQRDLQQIVAASDLEIQRAKATLDQAQVEFEAQQQLLEKNRGASKIEFDRAKAQLDVRRVEFELAKREREQQQVQLVTREAQLSRYTLRAPFDGVVDSVVVDLGEVKRETDPVLRLVNIDPLWLDVPTPTGASITLGLKPGSPAWVLLDLPGAAKVRRGKVIEVGAEADAGSNTRRIRVELANPEQWPAGLSAWVRFTEPEAGVAAGGAGGAGGGSVGSARP